MHLTRRPRVLTLSGFVVFALAFACALALHAGGAKAAGATSITGSRGTLNRISSSSTIPQGVQLNLSAFACSNMTDLPAPAGCGPGGNDTRPPFGAPFNGGPANGAGAPNTHDNGREHAGALVANFNGISDSQNVPVIGGHVTPPDQGLCVGPAGALKGAGVPLSVSDSTSVVIESVNESWTVYSTSGAVLFGPDSLADLFSDPFASGDVSCNYDPATQTFFFTEIGAVNGLFYGTGIAVLNAGGYAAYGADTSETGNCFPDFPQHGFNNNAFYITINEFCGPNQDFAGANLYGYSKSQLAARSSTVNGVFWSGLSLNGDPVSTLRPAIGDDTTTEYALNAVSYDAAGNPTNANTLGFWKVTGGANITSGSGAVNLSGKSIASEGYGNPVPAASTGDGSQFGPRPYVIQEQYLEPDDSRLEQVQFVSGNGPTRLYTSLDTALTVGGDPTPIDGAAWFDVNPNTGKVNHQGYVAVAGTNLLYPSLVRSKSGTLMMGFSMTSPTLNPSAGYTLSKNEGSGFSPVQTTGAGSTFHVSFSDVLFGRARWGDYSAIAFDPVGGNVWFANEYIPSATEGGADVVDNWGTRVWGLTP
jgi:hypothetical protein